MHSVGTMASSVRKDRCTRFSGTSYCDFGSSSTFDFERTDSFTVYAWARWTQASTGMIISRESGAGSGRGWQLSIESIQTIRFALKNTSGGVNSLIMDTPTGFNDGKWHSIAATYAGGSAPADVHIYVDGVDQSLTTVNNNLSATIKSTTPMTAGRDTNQGAFEFLGDIAGLAIFSGVLGATDRAILHNGRRPSNPPAVLGISGILGFWRMGNGSIYSTIIDETGANNGALTNLTAAAIKTYAPSFA